jgi:hypothetical protein
MRPAGHMYPASVMRLKEAASSWLMLWDIWNQFGNSDEAVERDMHAAEERLSEAVYSIEWKPDGIRLVSDTED